jgi:hypothetical protein
MHDAARRPPAVFHSRLAPKAVSEETERTFSYHCIALPFHWCKRYEGRQNNAIRNTTAGILRRFSHVLTGLYRFGIDMRIIRDV